MGSNPAIARTLGHALAELEFCIAYGSMNETFWLHMDTALTGIQLVAASLVLAGAAGDPSKVPALGVGLATVAGLQLWLQPLKRSIEFRDTRRKFQDLKADAHPMNMQQLDAAIERIRRDAPPGLSALVSPAVNRVEAAQGGTCQQLTFGERVARFIA